MLKHIQKHTHAFLFFLGGLFLMLVGPSLIPLSNAATVANTAKLDQNLDKNLNLIAAAANQTTLSARDFDATMEIVAKILSDIKEMTNINTMKAKSAIADLQNLLQTLTNAIKDNPTIKEKVRVLSNLDEMLTQTLNAKTTAAIGNSLKKAQELINEANNNLGLTVNVAAKQKVAGKTAVTVNQHAAANFRDNRDDDDFRDNRDDDDFSRDNNITFRLISLNEALEDAGLSKDFSAITTNNNQNFTLKFFLNFFEVAFQNLYDNLKTVVDYVTLTNQTIKKLEIENNTLKQKLEGITKFLNTIAPQAAKQLNEELKKIDTAEATEIETLANVDQLKATATAKEHAAANTKPADAFNNKEKPNNNNLNK